MDGISISDLQETLNYISDENFERLLRFWRGDILSSQDQSLLQKEITETKGMLSALRFKDSSPYYQHHETT